MGTGFAQAGNVFPITVLFKPRASMLQQCARFLVDPENNIFEIPMKLNVPDQKLPVSFTLRAQVGRQAPAGRAQGAQGGACSPWQLLTYNITGLHDGLHSCLLSCS